MSHRPSSGLARAVRDRAGAHGDQVDVSRLDELLDRRAVAFDQAAVESLQTIGRPISGQATLAVDDDLDALLAWSHREVSFAARGVATGADLSAVRASDERLSRGGSASGPVSFLRGVDAWTGALRPARARRAAALDAGHPDVLTFLEARSLARAAREELVSAGLQAGDEPTATPVVRLPDKLMHAAGTERQWSLGARVDAAADRSIRADALTEAIVRAGASDGVGVVFADASRSALGTVAPATLTADGWLSIGASACVPAHLNLTAFLHGGRLDEAGLAEAACTLVAAMDALVDDVSRDHGGQPSGRRPVALSLANLSPALARAGLSADTSEAARLAEIACGHLAAHAEAASARLAASLGPCDDWASSSEACVARAERRARRAESLGESADSLRRQCDETLRLIARHGLRNLQTTCALDRLPPELHHVPGDRQLPLDARLTLAEAACRHLTGSALATCVVDQGDELQVRELLWRAWRSGLPALLVIPRRPRASGASRTRRQAVSTGRII